MTKPSTHCPACGAPQTGTFCSRCGANIESGSCGGCGAKLPSGVKFCPSCGAPASGAAAAVGGQSDRTPWIVASVAIVGLLAVMLVMVIRSSPGRPPDVAGSPAGIAGGGAGPGSIDLSAMTPRDRFDRLYNRVMQAAEGGDPSTVANFAPMALQAYDMLPDIDRDPDARRQWRMRTRFKPSIPIISSAMSFGAPRQNWPKTMRRWPRPTWTTGSTTMQK